MPSQITLPSYAKINLLLRIIGRRADGFHALFTVFQTISLFDTISITDGEGLSLTCDDPAIPTGEQNLIIRGALALQRHCGTTDGASIHLEKRIPSPGGLGGGSSNAAVALIGLSHFWGVDVDDNALYEIAAGLGSDVPYFLTGGTAIGTGRGEIIEPCPAIDEQFILVVTPGVAVATKAAFESLGAETLTNEARSRILRVCRLQAESLDLRQSVLINDFEQSVFSAFPEIRRVKETLADLGAVNVAMSGSGASVFAIFDKTETRQAAIKALDHESTWRKFAVATISRDVYREALRCRVVSD